MSSDRAESVTLSSPFGDELVLRLRSLRCCTYSCRDMCVGIPLLTHHSRETGIVLRVRVLFAPLSTAAIVADERWYVNWHR